MMILVNDRGNITLNDFSNLTSFSKYPATLDHTIFSMTEEHKVIFLFPQRHPSIWRVYYLIL